MSTPKTFSSTWDGKTFECWRVGEQVRYRRPGEVGFKSLEKSEFKRYFKPIEGESWEPEVKATAVQGGLFG